jgi:hypothetical protein
MTRPLRAALVALVLAVGLPAMPAPAQPVTAIEYHHAAFDHYFIAIDPAEINALDTGFFAGWTRTGYAFDVYASAAAGLSPVCRFFSTSFGAKSSHFYTPNPVECDGVKLNPDWQYEGIKLYAPIPAGDGTCPTGTRAVYRMYNQGQGGAPNHRFTTELAVRATMLANGWVKEGDGPIGVSFCSPQPAVVPSSAAGIYTGTTSLNEIVRAIVVDDGRYFILYSSPGSTNDSGVWYGNATTANGTFATTDGKRFPIAQAMETNEHSSPITLSGSFVAQATLDLTVADTRGTRTLSAAYVAGSNQALAPSGVAGVYGGITGHVNGKQNAGFTVTSGGSIGGSNPVCSFAGTVASRALVNLLDVTLAPTGGSCIFGYNPVSGIVDFDPTTNKLRAWLPFDGNDIFYMIGTRN